MYIKTVVIQFRAAKEFKKHNIFNIKNVISNNKVTNIYEIIEYGHHF